MPIIAEVFKVVNGELKLVGPAVFEVAPQPGDDFLTPGKQARVVRARHVADELPSNGPPRMNYEVIVEVVN